MKRSDIELMAPAGSYESLMAAIQGEANSVYFGVEQLNMRAKSSNNFSLDDLKRIVGICNKSGIKSYLTVNTILYDDDIPLMKEIILTAKENGIVAIIASDMAAINYAHTLGIELHISTQLNISNIETLRFYSRFADIIVLARELSLKQIANITKIIENEQIRGPSGQLVKVEIFIHGALCMSVSGKCYLSLHENNLSANRGACLQICRRAYVVKEKESGNELEINNEYIMSLKDLSTISFLNKIIEAGVKVLKIEGRARAPEYVKTVVNCYDEAIHAILKGNYTSEKIKKWQERLASVYNRGFWDGYYLGRKMGEWSDVYGSKATKRKIYLGKGTNYFTNIKVAEFLLEAGTLKIGDYILITGPTTGMVETKVREIRVNLKNVSAAKKGENFSIPVDSIVRRSDKLYKVVDSKV